VDATALVGGGADAVIRVLREGAVTREALAEILGDLLEPDPRAAEAAAGSEGAPEGADE